jgi:hypothetical protein
VNIDAYLNLISVLNMNVRLSAKGDVGYVGNINRAGQLPVRNSRANYPQLKDLAWYV